jgi:hypothetical protein
LGCPNHWDQQRGGAHVDVPVVDGEEIPQARFLPGQNISVNPQTVELLRDVATRVVLEDVQNILIHELNIRGWSLLSFRCTHSRSIAGTT